MWRRCKSRRERCRRRGGGGGRRREEAEVVACLSLSAAPPPVQLYLPDPLGDANDLITFSLSLCTARDLNGVLIASNAAIWQRDAVHLKKTPPSHFSTSPLPLWKLLKQAARHFHCQLELHFTYLRLQIRSALVCKSVQVLEATTPLLHPFWPAAVPAIMCPYLKYIFASPLSTLFHLWQSVSANCPDLLPMQLSYSSAYLWVIYLKLPTTLSSSTLNLWPCDYCFTCLRISVSVSPCLAPDCT